MTQLRTTLIDVVAALVCMYVCGYSISAADAAGALTSREAPEHAVDAHQKPQ